MNINIRSLEWLSMDLVKILFLAVSLVTSNVVFASGDHDEHEEGAESGEGHGDEDGHDEGGHEEEQSVKLTARQLEVAGITVETIRLQSVADVVNAPGEIMLNEYKTTSVTPRVSAQVFERHAKMGDTVTIGQPLLTLSSVEMATAQGDLLVSHREWQRVKKLGRKVVSAQRYTEARVNHEQAKARTLAYGMTSKQAD
ncbi:MAG: efflux RND transporter periplasmic adaptor subunit, partial [Gammaproteobacteria bacterium]